MNICEHLTVTANAFPEKEAIVFEGQAFTFSKLNELSIDAANRLAQTGIEPGDRVAIMLPNVPAFVVWYFATLRIGAIAVSVSTRLTEKEVVFVLSDCGAKVLVAAKQLDAAQVPDCVIESFAVFDSGDLSNCEPVSESSESSGWFGAEPDDAALILYTSGTTGFAKGATLSHMNVRSNVLEFNRLCGMQASDRVLLAVPLFHCFGQNALLNSLLNVGATIILQRGFDLGESKRLISQQAVTQLYGVPTMFQLLHESCEPSDLASVRYCFSAAAKLPVQVSNRWQEKFGQPIYEGYGLTETSPFASYNHQERYVIGSVGTPIDLVEMKVIDSESGKTCRPGELGEIAIRGPNVMLGYWNRPEDTAHAIRDGWFYSGDIGRQDEAGFFYIVDRVKDMIAVGGLKVYPAEVERILLDHDSISQVAVVGFPDEIFGEKVVAFVVLCDGSEVIAESKVKALTQHCRASLAQYKVPKHFLAVAELPRNPAGKVLKTILREYKSAQLSDTRASGPTPSEAEEDWAHLPITASPARKPALWNDLAQSYASNRLEVATAFLQSLVVLLSGNEEEAEPDARFLDIGLDSLMIVEMSSQIQAEIGPAQQIAATLIFDYPKLTDLAQFLVSAFESSESVKALSTENNVEVRSTPTSEKSEIQKQVEAMTEEEALDELMRELSS